MRANANANVGLEKRWESPVDGGHEATAVAAVVALQDRNHRPGRERQMDRCRRADGVRAGYEETRDSAGEQRSA